MRDATGQYSVLELRKYNVETNKDAALSTVSIHCVNQIIRLHDDPTDVKEENAQRQDKPYSENAPKGHYDWTDDWP